MKLALDIWYEAWSRAEGEDARAALHGEAAGSAEALTISDGARRERGGRWGTDTLGNVGPPTYSGL